MATNPAASMPDADAVTRAIKHVDFTVVSEVAANTDTSVLTDVQLPATAWGEKTGTVTNSERRISLQKAFMPAPKETRPDWQIICDVAKRMGWVDGFSFESPAEIFREYASLSGKSATLGSDFDISGLAGISDIQYANFQPVQWPISENQSTSDTRFFGNGKFFHADGKAKMLPVTSPAILPRSNGDFHLNTGRVRDQWHMMSRSGKSARLSQHVVEPFAEIHPLDAYKLGVANDELVEIKALSGRSVVRARLSDVVQMGAIFVPMHWSATHAPTGRINAVIAGETDPISGQPALKGAHVKLRRFNASWYGFATSAEPMNPDLPYRAVARTENGWRCELAGLKRNIDWEQEARLVLNLPNGSTSIMSDRARGIARVAIHEGTILKGLFFAASRPLRISRTLAISQINDAQNALTVLAGKPATDRPEPGAIICACHNVGANTIASAIETGATTMVELGRRTAAGTNCGSCKSELQSLIDTTLIKAAAE